MATSLDRVNRTFPSLQKVLLGGLVHWVRGAIVTVTGSPSQLGAPQAVEAGETPEP